MKIFSAAALAAASLALAPSAHAATVTLDVSFSALDLYNWQELSFYLTPHMEVGGVAQTITSASIKLEATSAKNYAFDGETTYVRNEVVFDPLTQELVSYEIDERTEHYVDEADELQVTVGSETFGGATPLVETSLHNTEGTTSSNDCVARGPGDSCAFRIITSYKNEFELSGYNGDVTFTRSLSADTVALMNSDPFLWVRFDAPSGYFDFGTLTLTFETAAVGAPVGVPEPASWALMIAGFGLAGGMLRRRRAVHV